MSAVQLLDRRGASGRAALLAVPLWLGLACLAAQAQATPPKPPTPAVAPAVAPQSATTPEAAKTPDEASSGSKPSTGAAGPGQISGDQAAAKSAAKSAAISAEPPRGPAQSTWTTYLYQGPGYRYMVIDEVPQATHFTVLGCTSLWCEVQYDAHRGYLRQEIIAQGDPAQPAAGVYAQPAADVTPNAPDGTCFEANQTGGNGGNAMTVFCMKAR